MKRRKTFVSNSSSSSYVCEVCGHHDSGMDACPTDLGMVECSNGHVICDGHVLDVKVDIKEQVREELKSTVNKSQESLIKYPNDADYIRWFEQNTSKLKEFEKWDEDQIKDYIEDYIEYEISSLQCPICQLTEISPNTLNQYIIKKFNINKKDIEQEMKDKFNTIYELEDFVK